MAKAEEADKYIEGKSLDSILITALQSPQQSLSMRIVSPHYAVVQILKSLLCMVGLIIKWGLGEIVLLSRVTAFIGLGRTQGPLDSLVTDLSSTWTNRVIGKFDWEPGPITHDIMHETYVFDKRVDRKEARA